MMESENFGAREYDSREHRLDELFRQYGEACQAPDASPNFMPALWRKIEARQANNWFFGKMARGFVSAALAVSCILALFLALPNAQNSVFENSSYVEVLAADNSSDTPMYFDVVNLTTAADTAEQVN